jgi:beta-mannanase
MKRLALMLVSAFAIAALAATPASAASIRVKAAARPRVVNGATTLNFKASMSRKARIKISIYRGSTKVRTITTSKYAKTVSASWDLKSTSGAYVSPGTYTYVVAATQGTRSGKVRGSSTVASAWLPAPPPVDRFFGAYVKGAPDSMQPVADLESLISARAEVVNFYVALTEGFPTQRASAIVARSAKPLVTLEFWDYTKGVTQPDWDLDSITSGSHDAQIRAFARGAKAFGQPLWIRPLHEMNSNWYPWSGTANGNSPDDYVPAFRHIVDIFAAEGATNASFVWCPNNDSVPNTPANAISAYYPGDAYVDCIGLDGYNFGTGFSWSSWRSFSNVFGDSYSAVTSMSSKPVVICETGCSESGGSKAAWIADMFAAVPTAFPRVRGIVWFNTNAECDWRIESDVTSLAAFKANVAAF